MREVARSNLAVPTIFIPALSLPRYLQQAPAAYGNTPKRCLRAPRRARSRKDSCPARQGLYRAASIPTSRERPVHTRGRRPEGLLLILHHRNLRGQLEIDNRLKAAIILKEGRDRLARDYLAEYREILDSQLRYLFIDRQ